MVDIYSLSTNSWKSKNVDYPNCSLYFAKVIFILTVLSIGSREGRQYISLFDLSNEVFQKLRIPEDLSGKLELTVFGQSLALIQYESWEFDRKCDDCCISVLKDYGVSESWSKHFVFRDLYEYGGLLWVLGFRRNGEAITFLGSGNLASYDPETGKISNFWIQ
ncbi:uncharacterized protein LOC105637271 [Jatropha curcas]|uniref:uncharacterized protein LOC105637271 n=1 Tax=Jatropha curcas TaxID=180498 RepID=UPI0005FC27F8|nr:uncharacterized protein LOC105637271 [Jatropha curcas]